MSGQAKNIWEVGNRNALSMHGPPNYAQSKSAHELLLLFVLEFSCRTLPLLASAEGIAKHGRYR